MNVRYAGTGLHSELLPVSYTFHHQVFVLKCGILCVVQVLRGMQHLWIGMELRGQALIAYKNINWIQPILM